MPFSQAPQNRFSFKRGLKLCDSIYNIVSLIELVAADQERGLCYTLAVLGLPAQPGLILKRVACNFTQSHLFLPGIALAKEQLNHGSERSYETALVAELEGVLACMTTRDWQEGIDAFAAKRKPAFRGE